MIKKILFGMSLLLSVASCTDDYTDWNAPQHNDQPAVVTFGNGTVAEVAALNLAEVTTPTVKVADITAPTTNNGYEPSNEFKIALDGKTLAVTAAGEVNTEELQNLVVEKYGKAPEQRELQAVVSTQMSNGNTSVNISSNPFKVLVSPKAADIEQAYYLAGDMFADGWTKAVVEQHKFSHSDNNVWDDPKFKFTVETTAADQSFMIVPASSLAKSNILDGAWGLATAGVALNGELVNEGAQKITIADAGKYIITIDMENKSFEVAEAPTNLFLTGDRYDWGGTWKELTPVWGTTDQFWTIIYLHEGEQFKFAPQAGWGGDFGMSATVNDVAGAGLSGTDNCVVGKAGWYLLHVVNGEERVINVLEPNVYLMGDAVGEWNVVESGKFTVPATEDGEFVSPAFASDCELRMCISLDNTDWWKTEFIVANGNIDFRGRGGDQDRLNVTAGQKAYLNFGTGKGEVK